MAERVTTVPSYHGKRIFLGSKDLVVSFYTEKCPFMCRFCGLPSLSSDSPVSAKHVTAQIDWVFEQYRDELHTFRQLSAGNNGSILDANRFPLEAFQYLMKKCHQMRNLRVLSLETRPEYITEKRLSQIARESQASTIDVSVGFETQNDKLRNEVLNKHLDRRHFENMIDLLGKTGVKLTAFVMLKPGPSMTEREGIDEAVSTARYLAKRCKKANTSLVIYLNPTYVARNSHLARVAKLVGYVSPTIQSVVATILETRDLGIPFYVGLWDEGLSEEGGNYIAREDYDKRLREAVKEFNRTGDYSVFEGFVPEKVWAR